MRYLCVDIEAVRDHNVWTPPAPDPPAILRGGVVGRDQDLTGTIEIPSREVFPPPFAFRPIVIGYVMLSDDDSRTPFAYKGMGTLSVPPVAGCTDHWERWLLEQFAERMKRAGYPEIVTWNGRAFDLPVLMMRGLRHGITASWYYRSRDHRYRFSELGHLDLADCMSDYGAAKSLSLDGMGKAIGLPGKIGDISAKNIDEAYMAGRQAEISSYCLADSVLLAFLLQRWQLLKGEISIEAYRACASELLAGCAAVPALGDFVSRVDHKVLLIEPDAEPVASSPEAA